MTSRVEPPVVMTSSTTTTGSAGLQGEPAAERHAAVLPLREQAAAGEGPRDLVGHQDAPEGGGDDGRWHAPEEPGAGGRERGGRGAWPGEGP